jgi:hypothetical protein
MNDEFEDDYPCVGICQAGEDGLCRGCGRPMTPLFSPAPPPAQGTTALQDRTETAQTTLSG